MGEIITVVLLVSILWIIWDMVKMFLGEKPDMPDESAMREPGRTRLNQYAEAFERLSEPFLKLPQRISGLEKDEMQQILSEVSCRLCSQCSAREWCMTEHADEMCERALEQRKALENDETVNYFQDVCMMPERFVNELAVEIRLARQELLFQSSW